MEERKVVFRELLEQDPADVAEILGELSDEEATDLIHRLYLRHAAAEPLSEMDPDESADLVEKLDREEASAILARMDPDDAVDLLFELPEGVQQELLSRLSRRDAKVLVDLLAYPPDTAGGLMSPEIIPLSLSMTVQEAIDALRRRAEEAETVYYAYAVDDDGRLLGVLSLRDMALAPPGKSLRDLVIRDAVFVYVEDDVEVTALAAAVVVGLFEQTIAKVAALAVMMGVIAGQGGSAGMQTVAIITRGMALGEVKGREGWRLLSKELLLGAANGVLLGATVGAITYFWKGEFLLGVAVCLAMWVNLIVAGVAGVAIPLGVQGLGKDPALASGIFLTTVTDVLGFGLLFVIAKLLLPGI